MRVNDEAFDATGIFGRDIFENRKDKLCLAMLDERHWEPYLGRSFSVWGGKGKRIEECDATDDRIAVSGGSMNILQHETVIAVDESIALRCIEICYCRLVENLLGSISECRSRQERCFVTVRLRNSSRNLVDNRTW